MDFTLFAGLGLALKLEPLSIVPPAVFFLWWECLEWLRSRTEHSSQPSLAAWGGGVSCSLCLCQYRWMHRCKCIISVALLECMLAVSSRSAILVCERSLMPKRSVLLFESISFRCSFLGSCTPASSSHTLALWLDHHYFSFCFPSWLGCACGLCKQSNQTRRRLQQWLRSSFNPS